jgi:hypothetical protein
MYYKSTYGYQSRLVPANIYLTTEAATAADFDVAIGIVGSIDWSDPMVWIKSDQRFRDSIKFLAEWIDDNQIVDPAAPEEKPNE